MSGPTLWGLSDLHLGYAQNREALESIPAHPEDWIAVAGDVGETEEELVFAWRVLGRRFARVLWVPGNHELWTVPGRGSPLRGVARYHRLVELCRAHGVLTPEDPWPRWPTEPSLRLAPMMLLYDYSFAPDEVGPGGAVAWAREAGLRCRDEDWLYTDPHPDIGAWCAARCEEAERRLGALPPGEEVVLINHFPLRRDLVRLPRIERFAIWCGTRRTETWHRRFPIRLVVSGHLHMRATDWRDGVRFEEVSLGYPRHWRAEAGAAHYLRRLWPPPSPPVHGDAGPVWHR